MAMFVFSDALPLFCRTPFVNKDSLCFLFSYNQPNNCRSEGINKHSKEMIKANAVNTGNYSMWQNDKIE